MEGEVHIIAKGKGWDEAPDEGETWGVNDIVLRRDQLTLGFDMHDLDVKRKSVDGEAFKLTIEKATKNNLPIMVLKEYDFVPTGVVYPLDEIVKKYKSTYIGSSIDFMTALAMYKEFETINLYGVNMIQHNEYMRQKPSMEFWIGMAMGLGHKVNVFTGEHSSIMKTYNKKIYGYNLLQTKIH